MSHKSLLQTRHQPWQTLTALLMVLPWLLPSEAAFAQANNAARSYAPVVGKPHPALRLPKIDNRESVSLADYRGKKVLLIHFASW